ncbi:hypothetical protein SAMN05421505_12551 [Sinosporangium album]|uniref:Uncharacterized protein n=1 Tax=Sinosporangium album TaxID=504805 RepID=A0A1G8G1Y3_9ACTN|nr:hypothetical protein [Sinosporangium album]SDH88424.1 hypothetical protein SAMN05421505_12551 [Sinosporangium album]
MYKRIAIGALTAAVGGSMLLSTGTATGSTARALNVKISSVSPNPVVVKDGGETEVTIEVRTTEATKVELRLRPDVRTYRAADAVTAKVVHEGDLWRYTARFDDSDYEGRWEAIADAFDKNGKKLTDTVNFSVEIEESEAVTKLDRFYASPSSVKRKSKITVSGRLRALEDGRWDGLENEDVEIEFRARGTSAWKYVTSVDTGWNGTFKTKVRAKKSGDYRAVFEGDKEYADSTSRSSRVHVWR